MKGFVQDIAAITSRNRDFRRVLYTGAHCQLVVMSLGPSEDIGEEVHDVDQFFRIESGTGSVVIGENTTPLQGGSAIVVPAGARHNIINGSAVPLQLYTIYAPPHHRDGVVHHLRRDADADHEHFDGVTTERGRLAPSGS